MVLTRRCCGGNEVISDGIFACTTATITAVSVIVVVVLMGKNASSGEE